MRKCFGSLIFLFLFFKYACAFILPFLVKHDDCTYFLLFSIRFLRLKKTSKNRKWKKPCFEVFGLKLVQKNHSRFFGFLFAELCKKKLPTVERSLCFPWKRIWDTDYTRLQQNRKLSLTGNENLASNELFVWNSPSIFVCTIHQTVQKRSSKYDISLNIEKKRFERLKPCQRRNNSERRNLILTRSNAKRILFISPTTLFPEFDTSSTESKWLPFSRIDRQFIKHEPPFRRAPSTICFPALRFAHEFSSYCCRFARTRSYTSLLKGIAPKERAPTSQFSPHPPIPGVTRFNL